MTIKLGKITTTEAIVDHFTNQIEQGLLKPGDKLPSERLLQQQFTVSRFSLREGLARLSALGVISVIHGKGSFIAGSPDRKSLHNVFLPYYASDSSRMFEELFEARLALEGEIAANAAKRRTSEDIAALQLILDKSRNALDDPGQFGILDFEFHRTLATAAKNVFMERMLDVIQEQLRLFLMKHAHNATGRREAIAAHEMITGAVLQKNETEIVTMIKSHILRCKCTYMESFNTAKDNPA
jgi:GntR family transcriptional regulator, transcriptional repressor for pyruvate dehydrogenase complex